MSDKEETPEEIKKSRDSWKTWGIISIIGAVFCFIVAVLLLIFIFKYRNQLKECTGAAFRQFGTDLNEGFTSLGNRISNTNTVNKVNGGCDCSKGGCGACAIAGGCDCDMTGGAVNSSSFLNKLLKKK